MDIDEYPVAGRANKQLNIMYFWNKIITMHNLCVTRGDGVLEEFLARQRAKLADRLMPFSKRKGSILDIGCGKYPFFLINTSFSHKHGLDKLVKEGYDKYFHGHNIKFTCFNIQKEITLPFKDRSFDVVTILAVIEHIPWKTAENMFREVYRILNPEGVYIITTPAVYAGPLLRFMARIGFISQVEINEHKHAYSHEQISDLLIRAGFLKDRLRQGYFFLNTWTVARK